MCPPFCTPICCQIMVQAPSSKHESLLFPKQVRQEGECNGEAVGRGSGWVGKFRSWPPAPSSQIAEGSISSSYFLLFQKCKPIMCPSLSALVVYLKAVSFHSFTHSREHYRFYETSSFSETKAKSLIKEAGQDRKEGPGRELG